MINLTWDYALDHSFSLSMMPSIDTTFIYQCSVIFQRLAQISTLPWKLLWTFHQRGLSLFSALLARHAVPWVAGFHICSIDVPHLACYTLNILVAHNAQ